MRMGYIYPEDRRNVRFTAAAIGVTTGCHDDKGLSAIGIEVSLGRHWRRKKITRTMWKVGL
jgi:hypothetical protein